jgi:GcrA cell cycle regulator
MSRDGENFDWSEVAITRLRELWSEGHSTTEIGRRLGVSKNAIVGKAHRLDLTARPSPIKGGAPSGPRPTRQAKITPRLADMVPLPSCAPTPREADAPTRREPRPARAPRSEPRNLAVSRTETCCWPIGSPGHRGFRYCDVPALVRKPYCEDHANVAYRPFRRRDDQRDDAA